MTEHLSSFYLQLIKPTLSKGLSPSLVIPFIERFFYNLSEQYCLSQIVPEFPTGRYIKIEDTISPKQILPYFVYKAFFTKMKESTNLLATSTVNLTSGTQTTIVPDLSNPYGHQNLSIRAHKLQLLRSYTFYLSDEVVENAVPLRKQLDETDKLCSPSSPILPKQPSILQKNMSPNNQLFHSHFGYDQSTFFRGSFCVGTDILPLFSPTLSPTGTKRHSQDELSPSSFLYFPSKYASIGFTLPNNPHTTCFPPILPIDQTRLSSRAKTRLHDQYTLLKQTSDSKSPSYHFKTSVHRSSEFPKLLSVNSDQNGKPKSDQPQDYLNFPTLDELDRFLSDIVDSAMISTLKLSTRLANLHSAQSGQSLLSQHNSPASISEFSVSSSDYSEFSMKHDFYLISPAAHNSMLIHTNWRKTLDDINIQVRSFTDDPEPRPSQTSCSSRRRGYVQSDPPESKRHRTPLPGTRTVSFHPTTPHRTAVAFSPSLSPPITPVGHAAHHRLWRKHFLSSTGFDTHMQFPFLNTQPDAYVAGSGSIPLLNFDPISTRESIQKYDIDPNDPINFPLTAYVGLTHLFMTRQNRSLCHTTMVEPYFLALQTADLVCAFDTPAMTIGPTSTGLHRYVGLVGRLITKSKFGFINDLVSEIVQSPTNVSYSEFLKLYIAATQYPEISGILGFMSYEDLGWTSKKDWASFIDLFQKKIGDNHHSMSHTTLESQVTRKTRPGFAVMAQLTKPPEIPLLAEIAPLVTKHTGSFSKAINSSLASYLPTLVRSQREMFVTKFPPPRPISSGFMISSGSFHAILTVFELLSAEFRKLQVNIVRSWKQPIKREDRSSDLISTVSILRDTLWIMDIIGSILSSTVGSVGPQFVNITHNLEKEILKLSLLLHIIHADVGFWSYFRTYMLVDYRNRAKKSNDPNVRCDDEKQDEAFGIDLCHPFRDSPYFQPRKLPISQSASTHYICNTLFLPVFNFYQNARVDDYVQVIPTHPPHWSIYITEVTLCSCVQSFIKIIAGWGLGTEKTVHKNTADAQFSWKQRESIFHSAPHIHMYRLSPYGPWVKQVRDPNISDVTAGISSLPFLVLQKSNCKQAQFMRSQRICPSFHKVNYFGAIQTAYDIRFLIKTCCQKFNMPPQMILCQAQSIRLFVVLSAFCRLMMVVAGFPDPNEWGPYANKRLKLHYQSERKLMQCGDDHKPMMLPWVRATFLSGAVGLKKEKEEDVKCYGVDEECIYEDINWESNVKQTILTTWTFMKVIHGEPTLLPYTRSTPDHRKIGSKSHFNWMSCHAPCNIRFDDLPRTNPNVKDISHFRSPPVPAMPPLKHKSTSTPRRPFRPIRSDRSVGRPANSLQPTPTEVKDQQFPMDTNTPQSSLRLSPANQSQLFSPIQQNLVLIPRTSPSVQSSPLSEEMGLIELETPDADSPFEVYNDGDELPKTSRASNAGSNQGSQRSRSESPGPKRVFIEDQPKDDHQSPSWRDNWKTHHRSTSDGIPLLHEHRLLQGPTQKSSLSTLSNQSDDKLEHRNLSSPEHATENDKFNSESDTLQHDSSCSESGRILSPNSHASPPFLSKLGMRNRSFRLQSGSPKLTGTLFGLGTITTPHSQKRASFSTNQRITRENSAEHTLNETMNRGMGGIFAPAATEMILNTKGRRTLAVNQNLEAPPAPDPGSADWDQERFDSDLEDDMSNDDRSTVLSGSRSQVSASQPGSPNSRPTSAGSGSVESNLNSKFGFGLELLIPQQSNSGKGKEQHFAEKVLCANDDFSTPPCTESCNWCLEHGYQTKEMGPALSKPEDDQTSNVDDEIGGLSEDDYQVEGCLGGTMKYVPSTKHLRCRREKRLLAAWLFAELERLLYLSEAE